MFITSYNCKGLNVAKKHYIDKLLLECDICLIQEHWLLNNRLSDLNTDYKDCVTFAVSGMTEHSLITGRPYGGCAVFIRKSIKCDSTFINCENNRICAVLCDFKSYSVLIASVYMPCDDRSTINEYNFVLSCIEAAEQKYKPTYVIVGGDYNTDLSRVNSLHTKSLQTFCDLNNLQCVNTIGRPISYTFRSDMNSATSTIDHFVLSPELASRVNKYCTVDDIDNMSDHLPLCMYIDLPVNCLQFTETKHFFP